MAWRILAVYLCLIASTTRADETVAWAALQAGGSVMLLRHATTVPGIGDPPGFRLDDCATQRNLSEAGREEARQIGTRLRQQGVRIDRVLTSQWCRCRETARLLAVGDVEDAEMLNSTFTESKRVEEDRTRAVRELVRSHRGPGNVLLVTHQVNITALTGIVPDQGEGVVVRAGEAGEVRTVGRVTFSGTKRSP